MIETTTPDINPEILSNLDPTLLPAGNTKVTTTIKTYTYEIPGSGYKPTASSPEPEKYVYSPNQSQTTPSNSFVYSKVENNDVTNTITYPSQTNVYKETSVTNQTVPPYQKPNPPAGTTIIKETTRNYQPGYSPELPPNKQTYIYNETTHTTTTNEDYPDDPHGRPIHRYPVNGYPNEPPKNETYIYKETHNTTTNKSPSPYLNGYPPQERGPTTIIYKEDNHTTNYAPPPPRQPSPPPNRTVIINKTTNTVDNYGPNHYPPHSNKPYDSPHGRGPNEPYDPNNVNITYKYTTHTSNNYKGYPPHDESQPLLRPQPFPYDGEGPPRRVEELMAKIGNEVSL